MVKTRTSAVAGESLIATGQYTGDGAATQAIVGVGFLPRVVYLYAAADQTYSEAIKITEDGIMSSVFLPAWCQYQYWADMIISLDPDGFTIGDGTGFGPAVNFLDRVYYYVCWG